MTEINVFEIARNKGIPDPVTRLFILLVSELRGKKFNVVDILEQLPDVKEGGNNGR
jgi:hypothetical protein